jgi:hypothetical protein
MTWLEGIGYVASLLVFSTFYMKTMIPLRCVAIARNFAFIAYGFFGKLYPVLILHLLFLPLNVMRLLQIRQLIVDIKNASRGGILFRTHDTLHDEADVQGGAGAFRKKGTGQIDYISCVRVLFGCLT